MPSYGYVLSQEYLNDTQTGFFFLYLLLRTALLEKQISAVIYFQSNNYLIQCNNIEHNRICIASDLEKFACREIKCFELRVPEQGNSAPC